MELYSPLFTENQVKNTERIAQILSPYTDLEQKIIHELISHHPELFTNDTKHAQEKDIITIDSNHPEIILWHWSHKLHFYRSFA